jgi:hypothetical protein
MNQSKILITSLFILLLVSTTTSQASASRLALATDTITKIATDTVTGRSHGVDLDSLERAADRAEQLGTVTVTANLHQMNNGTETFIVTNEMRKGTISASQMLNNVPGISVDLTSEKVNIDGHKDVMILVNGQPSPVSFARSINPKRIEKVEIQRYPAGRFSNVPVLVNLVLKENYEGWDVAVRGFGETGIRTPHPTNGNGSVNFIYSLNKWDFNFSAETYGRRNYSASSYHRTIHDTIKVETPTANWRNPNSRMHAKGTDIFGAAKYSFNKNHSLRIEANAKIGGYRGHTDNDITETLPTAKINHEDVLNAKYNNDEYSAKIAYSGSLKKTSLSADLTYDFYKVNENSSFTTDRQLSSESHTRGKKNFVNLYIDGLRPINDKVFLQVTNNLTWRDYKNRNAGSDDYFFTSDNLRNRTDLRLAWRPKPNMQFVAGGSLFVDRQSQEQGEEKKTKTHVSPIPYLHTYWKFHKDWYIIGRYYSEVIYPVLDQLSPNLTQVDDYVWNQGNPNLRSTIFKYLTGIIDYKGKLKLNYTWATHDNDVADVFNAANPQIIQSRVNCKFSHWYINLEGNFKLPLNLYATFRAMHQQKSYNNAAYGKHTGKVWYLESQLSYFHRQSGLAIVGDYYVGHEQTPLLQGYTHRPIDMLKLTAQKVFFKNHLSAALSVQFPVRTSHRLTTTTINTPGYQSVTHVDNRINNSMVSLNLRVAFGNQKARRLSNSMNLEKEK